MIQMHNRVVITSMGAVTAAGRGIEPLWNAVCSGKSMIRKLNGKGLAGYIGAQVDDGVIEEYKGMDRATALALVAAGEAVKNSNLPKSECKSVNVFFGSSKGGINSLLSAYDVFRNGGAKSILPDLIRKCSYIAPADVIAEQFGFAGMRMGFVSSCATGIHSIIMGAKFISEGRGNVVIAGAAEAAITPLMLAGYDSMGALSKNTTFPEHSMKPFDRNRDGFAIGEGAGAVMLESLDSARGRNADIYAEITGWAYGCDTYSLTAHNPDGNAIAEQIKQALKNARVSPADIDYINAHGTATIQNDFAEVNGIKKAFGNCAENLHISSTKPVTGHLIGAAGSVEAIITALAMHDSVIPPTINLCEPDPAFDGFDFTPNGNIEKQIDCSMTLNFGFGGHIGALVLAKFA